MAMTVIDLLADGAREGQRIAENFAAAARTL
jgi:hypothetical protein